MHPVIALIIACVMAVLLYAAFLNFIEESEARRKEKEARLNRQENLRITHRRYPKKCG